MQFISVPPLCVGSLAVRLTEQQMGAKGTIDANPPNGTETRERGAKPETALSTGTHSELILKLKPAPPY